MIGEVFGRLTVLAEAGRKRREIAWRCSCTCGEEVVVAGSSLRRRGTRSCGCLQREAASKVGTASAKHGKYRSRAYGIWHGMRSRCSNPNVKEYPRYGGRGIVVCDRWQAFDAFYEDMGDPPEGLTLERVDNDGPYALENCRWATQLEQAQNMRTTTLLTHAGETLSVSAWARKIGVRAQVMQKRLKRWPLERALTEPPHENMRRGE